MGEAKQMYEKLLASPGFRAEMTALQDDELENLYKTHPMYKFYQNRESKNPYRIFGVCRRSDGKPGFHVAIAHAGLISCILDGVPAEEVEPVEAWDEGQLALIGFCSNPDVFLQPIGWTAFLDD